ncbi:MAG: class I SAM-dependent methyltransferase [Planctomycetota bacterium]|jgi:ubiquinone/menaquinone biosynthesis C-methylase UbiE
MRTRAPLLAAVTATLAVACSPAPVAEETSVAPGINAPYVDPDVSQWVERFEREGREIYDLRREIVAAGRIRPGADVADVGAGTGLFIPLLAEAVGPEGSVVAVDIVPEFVEHVRQRSDREGLGNVSAVLCTERSVELPAGSIDLAFICDTYHHFEYPASTMRSIHRALRRGGELVVIDFERIPGVSSDWILEHVRAGREVVLQEIGAVGFELLEEPDLLEDNYILRFRRR